MIVCVFDLALFVYVLVSVVYWLHACLRVCLIVRVSLCFVVYSFVCLIVCLSVFFVSLFLCLIV